MYLDSHLADHLSRLKLGKTHLNAQLHHSNQVDDPHCLICKNEHNLEIQKAYKPALFSCPNSQKIIAAIITTFFPDISPTNNFNITDILLSNISYKHTTYESPEGKDFINLTWDIYQTEIITYHTALKAPTPSQTIKKILSEAKDITKNLPQSKLALFIKNTPLITQLLRAR